MLRVARISFRAFSLTEVLIVMVIACAFIAASLPVMTKLLVSVTGVDEAAKICIATQHAASLSFTGTDSSININSSSAECKKAIQGCAGNGGAFCNTIIAYTKDKDAAHKNAAKNVIKAACDLGGSDACQNIVNTCITQNDCTNLNYYLALSDTSLVEGRTKIIDKSLSYYKNSVANLKTAIDNSCNSNGATACKIICSGNKTQCSTYCEVGRLSACNYLADSCSDGDLNACLDVASRCEDGTQEACTAMKSRCGTSQNVCDALSNIGELNTYVSPQCSTNKNDYACNGIMNSCNTGNSPACTVACNLGLKQCSSNMQKAIGGIANDSGAAIVKDSSGNIYVLGEQRSDPVYSSMTAISVIKLDSNLGIVWQKKIAGTSNLYMYGIDMAVSGNYIYILGQDSNGPYYVIKMDLSGTIIWQKTVSGVTLSKLAADSSGNVYIVGQHYVQAMDMNSYANGLLIKFDSSGNYLWYASQGEDFEDDYFSSASIASNGNIYVVGRDGYTGNPSVGIFNSSGVIQSIKSFSGASAINALDIALDSSNNVYITGYYSASSYNNIFAMKLDSALGFLWGRTFNRTGAYSEMGRAITTDSSGNIYITGQVGVRSSEDITVIKLNNAGTKQWQKHIGDTQSEYGKDIVANADGSTYTVGQQRSASTSDDITIIKLAATQTDAMLGNLIPFTVTVGGASTYSVAPYISVNTSSLSIATSNLAIRDAILTGLN